MEKRIGNETAPRPERQQKHLLQGGEITISKKLGNQGWEVDGLVDFPREL
jgi:hypothetical protein